jgi:predicted tellurium resistance membrane protein TerC
VELPLFEGAMKRESFAFRRERFNVYTSNVFAILGLRSLHFALSGLLFSLRYLQEGLAALLLFIGVKMLISGFVTIPITVSLGVIVAILTTSVLLSLYLPKR